METAPNVAPAEEVHPASGERRVRDCRQQVEVGFPILNVWSADPHLTLFDSSSHAARQWHRQDAQGRYLE